MLFFHCYDVNQKLPLQSSGQISFTQKQWSMDIHLFISFNHTSYEKPTLFCSMYHLNNENLSVNNKPTLTQHLDYTFRTLTCTVTLMNVCRKIVISMNDAAIIPFYHRTRS